MPMGRRDKRRASTTARVLMAVVALAILAFLGWIIFPVLNKAHGGGPRSCLTNVKQLCLAASLYCPRGRDTGMPVS